jgi:hypothetical protein
MRRLLDGGVDAIITDRPDILREVLVSRAQWAPMAPVHDLSREGSHPEKPVGAFGTQTASAPHLRFGGFDIGQDAREALPPMTVTASRI